MDAFDIFDEIDQLQDSTQSVEKTEEKIENKCIHSNLINEYGTLLCSECVLELTQILSYETAWR